VDFCPIARGPCQGRANCRLWIRGRIHNTDSKLLATQLARFIQKSGYTQSNPHGLNPELTEVFWQNKGIPNIRHEIIIDRYLRAKVTEVEEMAVQWLASPGFQKKLSGETPSKTKGQVELHTPRCKSPP
jgi:hypothetical protein